MTRRLCAALGAALFLSGPVAARAAEPLTVSLREAVARALSDGTAARLGGERVEDSKAAALEARAALLPRIDATASQASAMENLQALGFAQPGLPPVVGPFGVFDAHATAMMNIVDLAARKRYEAARQGTAVSQAELHKTENEVAAATASLYVDLQRADARVREIEAGVGVAENQRKLAGDQWRAGVGTRLDSLRAENQLGRQRQDLLVARNQRDAARLALLHAMGADMSLDVALSDSLGAAVAPLPSDAEALGAALKDRPEIHSIDESLRAAGLGVDAARADRYPTLGVQAQGGFDGSGIGNLRGVRTVGAAVSVPVFTGGQLGQEEARAHSRERQLELQRTEIVRQVEEDVRRALLTCRSATSRVGLSIQNEQVSLEELEVATHRYASGAATSIEVDNAQNSLSAAREARVGALADQAQAYYALARATGRIRDLIPAAK
jgi:outer membrane protein